MKNSTRYILSGVIVSNLFLIFTGSFFFRWMWNIKELDQAIALVLFLTIILITLASSIASYFWSHTGIPLKKLRLLAISNLLWVWILFLIHPGLGLSVLVVPLNVGDTILTTVNLRNDLLYNYFSKAFLAIIIICSLLGNWFGRRMFYE